MFPLFHNNDQLGVSARTARMQGDTGEERKKRSFKKFSYRGVDLEQLLELKLDALLDLFHARARRKCADGPCGRSLIFR